MSARVAAMFGISLGMLAAGSLALQAAKPKPDLAAQATFRCQTTSTDGCADRVRGDGNAYTYFNPLTTEGASINANGEFTLRFTPGGHEGGRFIRVDFGAPLPSPPCVSAACNPLGVPPYLDVTDGYLRTNVVNNSGAELAGGMLGMSCGPTYNSRLLITIPDTGGYWVVRFYRDAFPPSTFVKVTRTDRYSWTIDATPSDSYSPAAVLLWNGDSKGRPAGPGQEGTYAMPFQLKVVVPTAPACSAS